MAAEVAEKQKRILEFIQMQHTETGVYPSVREIALYMEFKSTNTVDYHLRRLEEQGLIERGGRRARAFSVPESKRLPLARLAVERRADKGVPLLGRVAAGQPILAEQNYDGMVNFRSYFHCDEQTFALRVQGESMIDAGIVDGDLVIVRQQAAVQNGDIAVALIGDEATVKRLFDEGRNWRLQPENASMKPIMVEKEDPLFRIAGKVIGVIRKI